MVNFRLCHLHPLRACGVIPLHSIRFNMPFGVWKINKTQFFIILHPITRIEMPKRNQNTMTKENKR